MLDPRADIAGEPELDDLPMQVEREVVPTQPCRTERGERGGDPGASLNRNCRNSPSRIRTLRSEVPAAPLRTVIR